MRIRQVKPAFWDDEKLAALPEAIRLFYIGLWMIADDGGWMRWNAVETGRVLYGFDSRGKRERRVVQMFERLVEAGRVVPYPCGHAYIPKLMEHQRLSGQTKQVRTFEREHAGCLAPSRGSPRVPADSRTSPPGKEQEREREQVSERHGQEQVARPTAPSGASDAVVTEFRLKVPRPA